MADEIKWITVNNVHIPINPGQSKDEAVKEFTDKQEQKQSLKDKTVEDLKTEAISNSYNSEISELAIQK